MVNILDVRTARRAEATYPVQRAADQLEEAENPARARLAQKQAGSRIRQSYYRKIPGLPLSAPPPAPTAQGVKAATLEKVKAIFARKHGPLKGPVGNAVGAFDEWYAKAVIANYPMQDDEFVDQFADFLMMVATEGFNDVDNTGTWMQDRRGGMRGLGFKDD